MIVEFISKSTIEFISGEVKTDGGGEEKKDCCIKWRGCDEKIWHVILRDPVVPNSQITGSLAFTSDYFNVFSLLPFFINHSPFYPHVALIPDGYSIISE